MKLARPNQQPWVTATHATVKALDKEELETGFAVTYIGNTPPGTQIVTVWSDIATCETATVC